MPGIPAAHLIVRHGQITLGFTKGVFDEEPAALHARQTRYINLISIGQHIM